MRPEMTRLLPIAVPIAMVMSLSAASSQETADAAAERQLTGEWQVNVNTNGALARMTLSLYRDGTYVKRVVMVNEFGWSATDTTLLIAPSEKKGTKVTFGPPMLMQISVTDTSLVARSHDDSLKFRRFTRVNPQSPLVGRWHGESDLGEELIEDFAPDGSLSVGVTITREAGMYSVKGGAIEWEVQLPNSAMRRERFRIDGDKLRIFGNPGAGPTIWERSPFQLIDNRAQN